MKNVAIICNIILFGFTCLVLMTDGISKETAYIVFAVLILLIPILNVLVLLGSRAGGGWPGFHLKIKTLEEMPQTDDLSSTRTVMQIGLIVWNIVLLGFICWAFVDQYPHPQEEGFIAYVLIIVLTPILSIAALLFRGKKDHIVEVIK